jgi:hypothetical protein
MEIKIKWSRAWAYDLDNSTLLASEQIEKNNHAFSWTKNIEARIPSALYRTYIVAKHVEMQYAAGDFGDIIDPVLLYSLQVGKRSRFE